jgi:hypothetical protein
LADWPNRSILAKCPTATNPTLTNNANVADLRITMPA